MKKIQVLIIVLLIIFTVNLLAYEVVKEEAFTEDGVTIGIKRYKNEGGVPVILMHGIVQNLHCWDLPYQGHSLAVYLAERGYDVWLPNLRSHGPEPYKSSIPEIGWNWNVDDFAVFDVPAIIDKVIDTTGQLPFWIGHSMGGMIAYMYLEGVKYDYVKVDERWGWKKHGWWWKWEKIEDIYDWRIVCDEQLSQIRNNKLRGLITVGSPAKMDWEIHLNLWNFWRYLNPNDYWRYNFLVEEISKNPLVFLVLKNMDQIPLSVILDFLTDDIENIPFIGPELATIIEWIAGNISDSFLGAQVWYAPNMTPDIAYTVLDYGVESISSNVLLQFIKCAKYHNWQDFYDNDPMREPFVYSDNYDKITLPVLIITGDKDKLANWKIIRDELYSKISSQDKQFVLLENFGHVDMCVGINAPTVVYPLIENWLSNR